MHEFVCPAQPCPAALTAAGVLPRIANASFGELRTGLLKYLLVIALAASVAFGFTAARGQASHPVDARLVVVEPGVLIEVRGIDLSCRVYLRDPRHQEIGPVMYCDRTSAPRKSRGIGASMWHYFISQGNGRLRALRVTRSP